MSACERCVWWLTPDGGCKFGVGHAPIGDEECPTHAPMSVPERACGHVETHDGRRRFVWCASETQP